MTSLARAETKRIMSVRLSVGSRLPAYCTSTGRVLLASLPVGELDAYLEHEARSAYTERTVTDAGALRTAIEQTRQRGFALVDQELEVALRSIAVPVRNAGGVVVAAMNASTRAARIGRREMEARFLPVLQAAAEEAGSLLVG
jgi:IclR family pca regulon transcriptional regulator